MTCHAVSHITLSHSEANMSPTYGLGVLAGRGGVVVVVAGGDIGVGVAPLVLHPRSPGVTMHLMPVLRSET